MMQVLPGGFCFTCNDYFEEMGEDHSCIKNRLNPPMKKVIMCKGLPASGKSTWARIQVDAVGKMKRISKDDLRAMFDNSKWSKDNEAYILLMRDCAIRNALDRGFSIIVDDTNLDPKHENVLRHLAGEAGAEFEIKDFTDVPLEECLKRDAKREKPVGEKVIKDMHERYFQKPSQYAQPLVQNTSLQRAIICDLDGTLAILNGRNPYDASTCINDTVNLPILNIVNTMARNGYKILFTSGRSDAHEDMTVQWIAGIFPKEEPFFLFMRKDGDNRKDAIVKREIFDTKIKDRFCVEFVLDDRNQVVEMWRGLGLTCLQVANGDF